jgi:prepilin-type N-terminal cleavage/methylation domain-containing protein
LVAHTRRTHGFTLVEVMVAVAIVGILAMLATSFMVFGTGRARLNNAAFEVTSLLSVAQIRATSTGVPHYAVFFQEGAVAGLYLLERADDPLAPVDWKTADISNALEKVGGSVRERILLTTSETASVDFAVLDGSKLPIASLPEPFAAISLSPGGSGTSLARACSFCITGGAGGTRGVLRFNPDGTVRVMTTSALGGGVIALTPNTDQRNLHTRLVVISAPSGVFRVF